MLVIARKWRDARKGTDLEHTTELAEQLMDAIDTVDFWQRKLVEHNGI
jgi:hypothetical protein